MDGLRRNLLILYWIQRRDPQIQRRMKNIVTVPIKIICKAMQKMRNKQNSTSVDK